MQSALSKEMGISQLQESYNHVGATCTPVFHKRITRTRHVQRYGRLLPTCTCCLMLVSWFGNKIRGNIQCRAVGTFLAHLAPLLLPLVPPQYLHNCFYFFPHSVLFIDYVMSLPFFSGVHVLIQKAQLCWGTIWHHCWIMVHFGLVRCFSRNRKWPRKFQRKSLCSEKKIEGE